MENDLSDGNPSVKSVQHSPIYSELFVSLKSNRRVVFAGQTVFTERYDKVRVHFVGKQISLLLTSLITVGLPTAISSFELSGGIFSVAVELTFSTSSKLTTEIRRINLTFRRNLKLHLGIHWKKNFFFIIKYCFFVEVKDQTSSIS